MVGTDGELPLPWLGPALRRTLQTRHAHALLVHGPPGVGQFELMTTLAQAWLCEGRDAGAGAGAGDDAAARPCGVCASCRLVQARSHPDLLVLLPEALREGLGWNAAALDAEPAAGADNKQSRTKPSREIKVDAVRLAVGFAQTTSARGRAKVVVVHPAERMNAVAANTLLKTLEEPPGDARFVLGCGTPDALLPTIRSRCQAVPLGLPPAEVACAWLARHGVVRPQTLLAAAGGQPLEALERSRLGIDAAQWSRLPALVLRGEAAGVVGWPLPLLLDALQKLCHDAACIAVGAAPRYFEPAAIGIGIGIGGAAGGDLRRLTDWSRELQRINRHAEHPWSAPLLAESLVLQGAAALAARPPGGAPAGGASLHSRS